MPGPAAPIFYAIYTRQSADKPDDQSACDDQFMACQAFVRQVRTRRLRWVGARYDDAGYSGATLERPALERLRRCAATGVIQRLYVTHLDRLSRKLTDAVRLMEELEDAGVELVLINEPELSTAADTRFLRNIMGTFAQFERELIASRLDETRAYLKRHGRRLAGPVPFGYDADPDTKQLIPNRREARKVRTLFEMADDGRLPSEIAQTINRRGWRTKARLSKRSGQTYGGGKWTARQILMLLRNPVYIGCFMDGESTRTGHHEPIVDATLFQTVQDQIDQRCVTPTRQRSRHEFPLRGKVRCPRCKRMMSTYCLTRRKDDARILYRYYRCRSTAGGRVPCKGVQFPAYEVEQFVCETLNDARTWYRLVGQASGRVHQAQGLAIVWTTLDSVSQRQLLPELVEQVAFNRRLTELAVTFSHQAASVIKQPQSNAPERPDRSLGAGNETP